MIITKTPFRMSFFGGGTDMESFFKENGGAVLSIAFVYNNRVREYDLGTGKMIVNQQVRNARGKEYLGKDITKKFIGKVVHRD